MLAEHCKPTNCTISMTNDNILMVTATDNSSNAFVELPPIDVSKLNGTTMFARAETSGSGTVSAPAICYMKYDDGQLAGPNTLKGATWANEILKWNFTVPDGVQTMTPVITATADSSTPVYWARMLISTRADAQTLVSVNKSQNLNYFDGSTRPE